MLCNFTKATEVVSHLNLPDTGQPTPPSIEPPPAPASTELSLPLPIPNCGKPLPPPPPPPPGYPDRFYTEPEKKFRATESGSWHRHYPGDPRIHLDLTRLIFFFDTDLFPSLVPVRMGKKKWEYRLEGISRDDVDMAHKRLDEVLTPPLPGTSMKDGADANGSGVDWSAIVRVVMNRYAERLELLQHLLRGKKTLGDSEGEDERKNWTAIAIEARDHLNGMLNPYIVLTDVPTPFTDPHSNAGFPWANSVYKRCAATLTVSIANLFYSNFTQSERLILNSVKTTEKEICRVLVRAWAEGV